MIKKMRRYKCLSMDDVEEFCKNISFYADSDGVEKYEAEINLTKLYKVAKNRFLEDNSDYFFLDSDTVVFGYVEIDDIPLAPITIHAGSMVKILEKKKFHSPYGGVYDTNILLYGNMRVIQFI